MCLPFNHKWKCYKEGYFEAKDEDSYFLSRRYRAYFECKKCGIRKGVWLD